MDGIKRRHTKERQELSPLMCREKGEVGAFVCVVGNVVNEK
jgi:hypothetical protein